MGHAGLRRNSAGATLGSAALAAALAGLCCALGCNADIGDDADVTTPGATAGDGSGASGTGGAGGGAAAPGGIAGTGGAAGSGACAPGALPPARAVLLSTRQYVNALRDLLGEGAVSDMDAAAAGDLEIEVVDRPWMTTAMLDQLLRLAEQASESLRGRTATFLSCSELTDRACVRGALQRTGLRAYKRPLEPTELDDVMSVYDEALELVTDDDGESAALTALTAILASPSTLYRTEFEATAAGATEVELSSYERAAALAGMLLDSVPDDALIAAAEDGSLMTPAGLDAQIDRLLALPRVREHLTDVVMHAYRAPRIFETPKDEALFPEYTPELQVSMYEETRRFVEDVLWTRHAPLSELITSRSTFIDATLAEIYGVPAPAGEAFVATTLPESRAGLLTQASVLSVLSRTDKTSVVARGLFVRGALLCLAKIPSPPEDVQAQVAMQLDADATQAELSAYRAMTSPCMNCHAQFDRFGLVLEAFDPIGRLRTEPVPAIDLTGLPPFSGVVQNAAELAQHITADGKFVSCMAQRTLAFALTEPFEPGPSCAVEPLRAAIEQRGGDMRALISALASQPAFARRSIEEP